MRPVIGLSRGSGECGGRADGHYGHDGPRSRGRGRRRARVLAVALAAMGLAGGHLAPAAQAGQPGAGTVAEAQATRCPTVAVLAARGSDQNQNLEPTRFNPESPWSTNGYEEENIRGLFQLVEDRHPGTMRDVAVVAMGADLYPAEFPVPRLAEVDEDLTLLETARRAIALSLEVPPPVMAWNAATGFVDSLVRGFDGVDDAVSRFEEATGCHPQWVMAGYSQGAAILNARERDVDRLTGGRLMGSLYFGNPLLGPGDPALVGEPRRGIGLLGWLPVTAQTLSAAENRVNYCLRDDFVCDAGVLSAVDALANGGGAHSHYFLDPQVDPAAAQVADAFATWVAQASQ